MQKLRVLSLRYCRLKLEWKSGLRYDRKYPAQSWFINKSLHTTGKAAVLARHSVDVEVGRCSIPTYYLETGQQSERDKEWVVPCCLSFFTCNTICIWRIWANPFLRTVHHVQCRWRQRKSDVLLRDSARLSQTNGDMSLCKTPLPSTHCNTGARSSSLSYVDCGFMAKWWANFKGLSVVGEWDKGVHMPLSMSSAVQFLTIVDCWREEETQSSSGWGGSDAIDKIGVLKWSHHHNGGNQTLHLCLPS